MGAGRRNVPASLQKKEAHQNGDILVMAVVLAYLVWSFTGRRRAYSVTTVAVAVEAVAVLAVAVAVLRAEEPAIRTLQRFHK
ncbi:MAG: hypothetical protein V8S27_00575 [Lachnospiraceae bacterium]